MGSLLSFERPIGTGADVSELEYATALMQTGMKSDLRLDCSLTGKKEHFALACAPPVTYLFILIPISSFFVWLQQRILCSF